MKIGENFADEKNEFEK